MGKRFRNGGIELAILTAYALQSNGSAGRYNCTLLETIIAHLFDFTLDELFWCESAQYASYLLNFVSSSAMGVLKVYEALFGRKTNLSKLKISGFTAHVFVPKAIGKENFGNNTKIWMFFGFKNGF